MKIHIYQIIITAVSLLMIINGIKNYIKGKSGQNFYKLFVRLVVWGGMATVSIFPSFTNLIAKLIGIESNINAVILSGFLLIFLMIFKLLSAIERLEQNISELTRKETLGGISKTRE